jgi:hypothetical protein
MFSVALKNAFDVATAMQYAVIQAILSQLPCFPYYTQGMGGYGGDIN